MIPRELLAKFYSELDISLRVLIHYRVLVKFGKPFDYFLTEEPGKVYHVLTEAMGRHNAELFLEMLRAWLGKNGRHVTVEELKRYLSESS